jgi:hypothetical protein
MNPAPQIAQIIVYQVLSSLCPDHGFLATPNSGQNLSPMLQNIARPLLTGSARKVLMRRLGIRAQ